MNRPSRVSALLLATLLLLPACERYDASHDEALRQTLGTMRAALAKFREAEGRYPHSLEELVPTYLPQIPVDPFTSSASTWRLTTEEMVTPNADFVAGSTPPARSVVVGVNSGAPGADRNGTLYSNY